MILFRSKIRDSKGEENEARILPMKGFGEKHRLPSDLSCFWIASNVWDVSVV